MERSLDQRIFQRGTTVIEREREREREREKESETCFGIRYKKKKNDLMISVVYDV